MGCDNDDDDVLTTFRSDKGLTYNESLEKWTRLKSENGNSYTYEITRSSVFGFSNTTTLTIQEGKIIARSYESYIRDPEKNDSSLILEDSYEEDASNLGSNKNGAGLKLIDDYYNDCSSKYLVVNTSNNILTLKTNDLGITTSCGYSNKECQDDCFRGYVISFFEWAK